MITSGFYKPKITDIPKAICVTLVLAVFALIANATLDADFMLLNRGTGNP